MRKVFKPFVSLGTEAHEIVAFYGPLSAVSGREQRGGHDSDDAEEGSEAGAGITGIPGQESGEEKARRSRLGGPGRGRRSQSQVTQASTARANVSRTCRTTIACQAGSGTASWNHTDSSGSSR